ncbi:MAG: phosphoribosylamine--glycine ligase [Bacteroidales bacterium]|nr:phosphoribosylamine--glycine ligase [Bacteroidales bacterium]
MNILILGSGGREHAIAWKLSQSKKVTTIYTAPGNAGTDQIGVNLNVDPEDFAAVRKVVVENNIRMVVVGPEAPLVAGITDFFQSDAQLKSVLVIGPDRTGAMLEGSKQFAKEFMKRHNIPTAGFGSFVPGDLEKAVRFLQMNKPPYVLKADGLASGKGVLILDNLSEAEAELKNMFAGKFGSAGKRVVIEEFLKGIELSVIIITDGKTYKVLPPAKDYKRAGEGGTGPNTGGMGAVSPVPFADDEFLSKVEDRIIKPTLRGLQSEGNYYKGFIFFGLMKVDGEPYVIEYNARLGDPETEVILPRISSDLFELLEGVAEGNLEKRPFTVDSQTAVTVMLVSGGYPGDYEKGKAIDGLERCSGSVVFHAGTRREGEKVLTAGGRVLSVTSVGKTMEEALEMSYRNADVIEYDGKYLRRDIGYDLK